MLETMNRAAVSAKKIQETCRDALGDSSEESTRNTAGPSPSSDEHPDRESALAYDLLLPKSATAIASIRVAGDAILSRPRRDDDVTMVWCRLAGDDRISGGESIHPRASPNHRATGRSLPFAPASLDCVVLHGTLDRWRGADTLLSAIRIALKPDGVVALTVANRFDPAHFRRPFGSTAGGNDVAPIGRRRSLWGYGRLLRRCGLSPTASFFILQNPGATPTRIISTSYTPSTTFFRHQSSALTGPKRLLVLGLNAIQSVASRSKSISYPGSQMIDLITDVLDQRGLIPADRFEACNIYIGKNLVFHVYGKGGDFVVAKVRESAEAEAEFAAMELAHETMPEIVPRPFALQRIRDTYLMLIEGVPHEPLVHHAVQRHGRSAFPGDAPVHRWRGRAVP